MMADLDKETVDFVPNFDETTEEPTVLPTTVPEPAGQRIDRHRRRHGDQHPAAQHAGGHRRRHRASIEQRSAAQLDGGAARARCCKAIPGPDFPTGGSIVGRAGHLQRLHDRPRRDHACARKATTEESKKGDKRLDRHHRDSVSRSTRSGCSRTSPTWCARRRSRASRTCATSPIATACGSSSS